MGCNCRKPPARPGRQPVTAPPKPSPEQAQRSIVQPWRRITPLPRTTPK